MANEVVGERSARTARPNLQSSPARRFLSAHGDLATFVLLYGSSMQKSRAMRCDAMRVIQISVHPSRMMDFRMRKEEEEEVSEKGRRRRTGERTAPRN